LHGKYFAVKAKSKRDDEEQGLNLLCILLLKKFVLTEILTAFYKRIFNGKRKRYTDGFTHFGIIFFQLQSSERVMKTNVCQEFHF